MKSDMTPMELRVLLIEEENGWWSAQCLEYDIAAQAKRLSDLPHELDRVLMAHLVISTNNGEEPFARIGKAPQEFWDMYDETDMEVVTHAVAVRAEPPVRPEIPPRQFRVAERFSA